MIKIDKENWKVETDCKTVGDFMTEAAELSGGNITIIVDGCRYEFHDDPEIRVTDGTPLGSVAVERADSLLSGVTVLRVTTAPKPKTEKHSGWINIFRISGKRIINGLYESNVEAENAVGIYDEFHVATVRVEWEEVVK